MNYMVFDMEFNQDFTSMPNMEENIRYPFEIIQIGAIMLDSDFHKISTYNCFIKPDIYDKVSPYITELTGITTEQLFSGTTFIEAYKMFTELFSRSDTVFCVWGMSDIKELYRTAEYYYLDTKQLPRLFINIQPYASVYLGLPFKKLLKLKHVVEALNIPMSKEFHNALSDAYYTSEIFKIIYTPSMKTNVYDPNFIKRKRIQKKQVIDFDNLIKQFEKMLERDMKEEEKNMITLAYKMGRTGQFLK